MSLRRQWHTQAFHQVTDRFECEGGVPTVGVWRLWPIKVVTQKGRRTKGKGVQKRDIQCLGNVFVSS